MRKRDIHQVRTFIFRPGETVTLKAALRSKNSSARFRVRNRNRPNETSAEQLALKMPSDGMGSQLAELDVNFAGKWNTLHLDRDGIDVLVQGSKGVRHIHHILPGPSSGRWTYHLVSVEVESTLYLCPEIDCENRMLPVTDIAKGRACPVCGGIRMISLKVRS